VSHISGTFEGLIVAKEGTGKRGPWKLYNVLVDGKKYGIGFNPVKAATGDLVEFDAEENEKGYMEADPKSFKVVGRAPASSSPSASTATSGSASGNDPRQRSIETQACIKAAAPIVAAMIQSGADINPGTTVAGLVREFMGILHPKPKPAPAPKPAPEPEPDFDDDLLF
jgi:hypothetical protein